MLEYVLSHLSDGKVETIYHGAEPDGDFVVDVKVNNKWYTLRIQILPSGGACA